MGRIKKVERHLGSNNDQKGKGRELLPRRRRWL